jgi:ABC-2 type transport system ATP-binding protein
MIKVNELVKIYTHEKVALNKISFDIPKGMVCGYLGSNGAGKTTTVKILMGMLSANSGSVLVNGLDVFRYPSEIKMRSGYVPEYGTLFPSLTIFEYLQFVSKIYGLNKKIYSKRIYDFTELFDIRNELNTSISSLSQGMKQKILIISSLIHNPDVIFWDEPLYGLDYKSIMLVMDFMSELSGSGKTFLYSSHLLDIVNKVCNKVVILNKGKIVYDELITSDTPLESVYNRYVEAPDIKLKTSSLINDLTSLTNPS